MTVSGIQFDKMKVYPEQDALLYQHLSANSDKIINGYKNSLKVSSSGLNIYIETGAALIQGRLVMVDELEKLTVGANTSGFVCLTIDLTQYNTFTGNPGEADYRPVNNQVRAEILESLVQQDLKNDGKIDTFPLASYTSTGTSVQLQPMGYRGLSENENLWKGLLSMGESHTITPSKKLSECKHGWILRWNRVNQSTGQKQEDWFVDIKIFKSEIGRQTFILPHAGEPSIYSVKLIDIKDSIIIGHNSNDPGTVGSGAVFKKMISEVNSF